jgi:two-component system cell cycle response regulator DivK
MKILIVEDNEKNRTLIKDVLEYHGYEVIEAGNGLEGIKIAKENNPDLILMDLQMPVMNGYEAIKIIKTDAEIKYTKIIAITSFAMVGDREKILEAGADEYISKPIDIRQLPEIVKNILGS